MARSLLVDVARTHRVEWESFLAREWKVPVDEFAEGDYMCAKFGLATKCQCDLPFETFKTLAYTIHEKIVTVGYDSFTHFWLDRLEYVTIVLM